MSNTRQKIHHWIQHLTPDLRKLLFLGLLLSGSRVLTQPWYLPTDGADSVFIENTSRLDQKIWLSTPIDPENQDPQLSSFELPIDLSPLETKEVDLKEYKKFGWIQIKSYETVPLRLTLSTNTKINFQNSDSNIKLKTFLPSGRSELLATRNMLNKQSGHLFISNLSPISQENIKIHTRFNNLNVSLGKFQSQKIPLDLSNWDQITIEGQYSISAYFVADNEILPLLPQKSKTQLQASEEYIYFNMSNQSHTQSFIFRTNDPKIILQARHQIENPDDRLILFATIGKGHQNFNRDLSDPLKPVWSWGVVDVLGFGFFASQECDGSPQIVEDYLIPWLSSQTNICFWNYKIERELLTTEVSTGYSP